MNTRVVTRDVWPSEPPETKQLLSLRKIAIENLVIGGDYSEIETSEFRGLAFFSSVLDTL